MQLHAHEPVVGDSAAVTKFDQLKLKPHVGILRHRAVVVACREREQAFEPHAVARV